MSELKEYFKDQNMHWDLEHFDEYSQGEKDIWKQTIGFKRWKAVKDLREAVEGEIMPYSEKPLKWLNDKLS